jgi:hypothetical protein
MVRLPAQLLAAPVFSSSSDRAPHIVISASFLAVSMSYLGSFVCTGLIQAGRYVPQGLMPERVNTLLMNS